MKVVKIGGGCLKGIKNTLAPDNPGSLIMRYSGFIRLRLEMKPLHADIARNQNFYSP